MRSHVSRKALPSLARAPMEDAASTASPPCVSACLSRALAPSLSRRTISRTFCQGTGDKAVKDFLYQLISVNGVLGESATPANANAPASSVPLPAQLMDGLLYGTTDANYDLSGKTVMVAAWANANFENIADWTSCDTSDTTDCATELTTTEQLSAPSGDLAMSWDDTTKTCKNVAVGVHIDVLTAKVGHLDHAQSKVQRVQVGWNYADWTYTDFPWDARRHRPSELHDEVHGALCGDGSGRSGGCETRVPPRPAFAAGGCLLSVPQRRARRWARCGFGGVVCGSRCSHFRGFGDGSR